ncbi:DNA polymerase III subunit beta [Sphaerisporangium sp. NPDC049002]|uniref:DNA polymerase III subunit beta n=1 Tax=Sphaerisporangium sp. NPDC049002 TaxID=3155392 RepID=UPI0033C621DA
MKTNLDHRTLAEAVAWTTRFIAQRPAVPVLAGVLLAADGDKVTLSVFDYDVSARCTIPADIAEPGVVLLPGRVLAEITKSLPARPVEMALSGSEVEIVCGSAKFGLLTMPADDYPTLPGAPAEIGTVDAAVLRDAITQVHHAASNDDTLPMLTGIRLDNHGGQLNLATTDRYRIAHRELSWQPTVVGAQHAALIPARVLHDIARGLTPGLDVHLGLDDKQASVTNGGRTTTVRLLDPQFIDYRARLDDDMPTWATLDVAPFADAIKRVALVAEKNTAVRLSFDDGQVLVQAGGGDVGRGAETVACHLDGPPLDIAFQPHYLVEAVVAAGVTAEQVRIGMHAPNRPALVAVPGESPDFRELVMSLRLA